MPGGLSSGGRTAMGRARSASNCASVIHPSSRMRRSTYSCRRFAEAGWFTGERRIGDWMTPASVAASPRVRSFTPLNHPTAAKHRQEYVLRRMREEGWITDKQYEAELARPIAVHSPEENPPGEWYADAVRKALDERYGAEVVETEGLQVDVAMDPMLQRYAEAALEAGLRAVDKRQGFRGPLLHLEPGQLDAALPIWRAKLTAAEARPGQLLAWD